MIAAGVQTRSKAIGEVSGIASRGPPYLIAAERMAEATITLMINRVLLSIVIYNTSKTQPNPLHSIKKSATDRIEQTFSRHLRLKSIPALNPKKLKTLANKTGHKPVVYFVIFLILAAVGYWFL
jgi:hypothetical protein